MVVFSGMVFMSSAMAQQADAPIPRLERPMDLVTTAGIDSQGAGMNLEADLENVRKLAPVARQLGFNAIEMYVPWRVIEPEREGKFDFSYFDALVAEVAKHDLKWFPLLIVGSAYALPQWFIDSDESVGMRCIEHGKENLIQSIWSPHHRRHVVRVLNAIGEHYGDSEHLRGVRLGPSGNYGESQYPAGGNWPVPGREMHIHIGLWCDDDYARADFRETMRDKYGDIEALNAAWDVEYESFDDIKPLIPDMIWSKRHRLDQGDWYTDSMSDWCAWWARVARKAMPDVPMYQSAGGWGFHESGTDYTAQTQAMAPLGGGIRLTNETDSFEQDFYATRLAITAAKHYGVKLGFEPASSHTHRGVSGRLFNALTGNTEHWFTYHPNIFNDPAAIEAWRETLPLMDTRQPTVVDVAVYYPETFNRLDDSAFRHLYAWGFNPRAREIRRVVDVDYVDERLIRDGALDDYKALVFAWGNVIEADVQAKIDAWIRAGGRAIYPSFPRGPMTTVEGDAAVFRRWESGDTGDGAFHRFTGDMEPPSLYGDYVREVLLGVDTLDPRTAEVLRIARPERVFFAVQAGRASCSR